MLLSKFQSKLKLFSAKYARPLSFAMPQSKNQKQKCSRWKPQHSKYAKSNRIESKYANRAITIGPILPHFWITSFLHLICKLIIFIFTISMLPFVPIQNKWTKCVMWREGMDSVISFGIAICVKSNDPRLICTCSPHTGAIAMQSCCKKAYHLMPHNARRKRVFQ